MTTYLLILALLFVNFWGLKPFGAISSDMNLMLIIAMLFYGYNIYGNKKRILKVKGKYNCLWWIIVGILISTITTKIFYGQDIITSLIVYRSQILFLTLVVLFKIQPTIEEMSKALFLFAGFMFVANILIISDTEMFVINESSLLRYEQDPEQYKLRAVNGVSLLIIPLYYYLQKLRTGGNLNTLLRIFFIFAVIYIAENRSTLFPATIITLYSLTRIKSKYKTIILVIMTVIISYAVIQTYEVWENLILETQENIDDDDGNRNKALLFFTTIGQPSWITYLFGNGIISIHTSNYTTMLMENGIYYSDVGFIGYWYNFGIIPIVAMLTLFIKALKSKNQPYFIKFMVIHIIICGLTTSYFYSHGHLLLFMFFYYLYYYNKYTNSTI